MSAADLLECKRSASRELRGSGTLAQSWVGVTQTQLQWHLQGLEVEGGKVKRERDEGYNLAEIVCTYLPQDTNTLMQLTSSCNPQQSNKGIQISDLI